MAMAMCSFSLKTPAYLLKRERERERKREREREREIRPEF